MRFNFGPIGVNNVLGEQKGEKLIWAGEPKKASVIKKKRFQLDVGGYLRSWLLVKKTVEGVKWTL